MHTWHHQPKISTSFGPNRYTYKSQEVPTVRFQSLSKYGWGMKKYFICTAPGLNLSQWSTCLRVVTWLTWNLFHTLTPLKRIKNRALHRTFLSIRLCFQQPVPSYLPQCCHQSRLSKAEQQTCKSSQKNGHISVFPLPPIFSLTRMTANDFFKVWRYKNKEYGSEIAVRRHYSSFLQNG